MNYKVEDKDVIFSLRTVKDYRESHSSFEWFSSSQRVTMRALVDKHPEIESLLVRFSDLFTPLLITAEGESLFNHVLAPFKRYEKCKVRANQGSCYSRLVNELLRVIHIVFDYNAYALTSESKIDARNRHWDVTEKTMRTWLIDNKVNKLSVEYRPIKTDLNHAQLGMLVSRLVFTDDEMCMLSPSPFRQIPELGEKQYGYQSPPAKLTYCPDIKEWLHYSSLFHSGLHPVGDALLEFLGTELKVGEATFVDNVMSEALTAFHSVLDSHNVTYAYKHFTNSILKSLSKVFHYRVFDKNTEEMWYPYRETFTSYRERVGSQSLTIRCVKEDEDVINVNAALSIIPFIFTRNDMVALSLPSPGCNVVIAGCSKIIEEEEYEYSNS